MAKAFLISHGEKSIETIELNDLNEVPELGGYDTVESDGVEESGDRVCLDEECFIRGTSGRGEKPQSPALAVLLNLPLLPTLSFSNVRCV